MSYAIGICTPIEIDKYNILWASVRAMHKALNNLGPSLEHILVDGNRFKPFGTVPYTCVVKGDGKYMSIAAASILAKTYRDECMEKLDEEYPAYQWSKNKGYPTTAHRKALVEYGPSPYHRKSFRLDYTQAKLF